MAGLVAAVAAVGAAWWSLGRGESRPTELFVEAASTTGRDPFTGSSAIGSQRVTTTTAVVSSAGGVEQVAGGTAGLYGGTLDAAACDREKQIGLLTANPAKASAFARVVGIGVGDLASYVRGLTPVVLLVDTRVTNHGFADGKATARQSVLQAGTAVLVDRFGAPRVRCRCGNPLTEPKAVSTSASLTGPAWSGYGTGRLVSVTPATRAIAALQLVDLKTGARFTRPVASTGDRDSGGATTSSSTSTSRTTSTRRTTTTTSRVTTTSRPGTTTSSLLPDEGGSTFFCTSPEMVVSTLVAVALAGDERAASMCAKPSVVAYLWTLGGETVRGLRALECKPADAFGLTGFPTGWPACSLTNGAIIVMSPAPDAPGEAWMADTVVLT